MARPKGSSKSKDVKAVEEKAEQLTMQVDKQEFIRTRDALITSWVTLEGALRDATRAYISHSNAVIGGSETLDITKLDLTTFLGSQSLQASSAAPAASNVEVEEVKPKQKRVTKPKDPNAPKRPLTAYLAWLGDNREKIHAELGAGQGRGGISSEGTKRWHALPESEHQKYKDAYEVQMDQWRKDILAYTASIGGTIDPKLLAAQEVPDAPEVAAADTESSDDDDSDESDAEEAPEKEPTPPPVKTPRSSKKAAAKKTAVPASSPPPASSPAKVFTAVNGATSGGKRKNAAAAKGEAAEEPKKKRSKKEEALAAAPPASEHKKKKSRKSATGVEA